MDSFLHPLATLTLVEVIAAVFFVLCRRAPVRRRRPGAGRPAATARAGDTTEPDLPVYTVLVPLRHEAHMLRQLL